MNVELPALGPSSRVESARYLLILASSSMVFWTGLFVVSPLLPSMIRGLSISPAQAGFAVSAMWLMVAICRYPGGVVADQLSRKTALVGAYGLAIVGFAVLISSSSYAQLLAGLVLVGVGAGTYMPAAVASLADMFADHRGKAFGVHEMFIDFGGFLAGMLTVGILSVASWRGAFVPVVVSLGVMAVLVHRSGTERYVVGRVSIDPRGAVSRLSGGHRLRWTVVTFALFTFAWQGVTSFLPTFLQFEKGFTASVASQAFAGLFLAGMAMNLFVPSLGDRFGYDRVSAAVTVVCSLGVGLVVVGRSVLVVLVGIGLFSTGLTLWAVLTTYLIDSLSDASLGAEYGAVTTVSSVVGSFGSTFVGAVASEFTYSLSYVCLIGCLLGAGVAVLLSRSE